MWCGMMGMMAPGLYAPGALLPSTHKQNMSLLLAEGLAYPPLRAPGPYRAPL